MGADDKVSNKLQELGGKGKEAVGDATGNEQWQAEGKADQTKVKRTALTHLITLDTRLGTNPVVWSTSSSRPSGAVASHVMHALPTIDLVAMSSKKA